MKSSVPTRMRMRIPQASSGWVVLGCGVGMGVGYLLSTRRSRRKTLDRSNLSTHPSWTPGNKQPPPERSDKGLLFCQQIY
ncbi:unnamed protein product [Ectocarpus sp. 8 AP-2014]